MAVVGCVRKVGIRFAHRLFDGGLIPVHGQIRSTFLSGISSSVGTLR